jgi:hypothetical protein
MNIKGIIIIAFTGIVVSVAVLGGVALDRAAHGLEQQARCQTSVTLDCSAVG